MAVFLSPGVFTREIDLSLLPSNLGTLRPAFIGAASKGPLNVPTLITSAAQFVDTFGDPFPTSYLGYATLAYLEEGNSCYVLRVGVEYYNGIKSTLEPIAIDTAGTRKQGWGRIPVFKGMDFGRVKFRPVGDGTGGNPAPVVLHAALSTAGSWNDAEVADPSVGAVTTTVSFVGGATLYSGCLDDVFTLTITGDPGTHLWDGATYVVTNSSGDEVASGTFTTTGAVSNQINLALNSVSLGVSFTVTITNATQVGVNDTLVITSKPDNRTLTYQVDGGAVTSVVVPAATYSSNTTLINAINVVLGVTTLAATTSFDANGVEVVALQTDTVGDWIQLAGTCAFCAEVGVAQYTYDIPRSHLLGTNAGPYNFSSSNNRVVLDCIGSANTVEFNFVVPAVSGTDATTLAAALEANSNYGGTDYFTAFALTIPGGDKLVVVQTSDARMTDQLKLLASYSHFETMQFANEIGILPPYTSIYRTFTDARLWLPEGNSGDPTTPQSCIDAPSGTQCVTDSAYYDNIVGWVVAKYAGTWSSGYTISLEVFTEGVGDVAGRYKVTVKDGNGMAVDVTQDVSFDPAATRYIGNVVNAGSPIGGVTGNTYFQWEARPSYLGVDVRNPSPFTNTAFVGGENGIPTETEDSIYLDQKVIGNPALSTGIYALQNPEAFDFNLLATPGFSSGPVLAQGIQFCENRGDVLYLIDPPVGLRPQEVIDWHNGMLTSDLATALNTSYAALYWSWLKISDQYNGGTIWVPPSGHIAAVFARTDRVAEQWYAPAGLNRGSVLSALDVEYNPTQSERDALYGSGNAVNAIVNFIQQGITVWGQRTLQRQSTALDRVNVRMLCISLKKNLSSTLRNFVFEFNDGSTRAQIRNLIEPYLGDVAARRGLTAFKVVCDETNNTPERIDRNELWVSVFIKPNRSAEFIVLNLVILRTGASFGAQEILVAGGVVSA